MMHTEDINGRRINDSTVITCAEDRLAITRALNGVLELGFLLAAMMERIEHFGNAEGYVFLEMQDAAEGVMAAISDGIKPAVARLEEALAQPTVVMRK